MGTVRQTPSAKMQSLTLLFPLLASALALPQQRPDQRRPVQIDQIQERQGYAPVEEVELPQPYKYQYGVKDEYSNSNFAKTETQDDKGNVAGTFVIALPDGRIQTTKYTADPILGFIAEVTYQGEPVYPPPPAEGYTGEQPRRLNAIN